MQKHCRQTQLCDFVPGLNFEYEWRNLVTLASVTWSRGGQNSLQGHACGCLNSVQLVITQTLVRSWRCTHLHQRNSGRLAPPASPWLPSSAAHSPQPVPGGRSCWAAGLRTSDALLPMPAKRRIATLTLMTSGLQSRCVAPSSEVTAVLARQVRLPTCRTHPRDNNHLRCMSVQT